MHVNNFPHVLGMWRIDHVYGLGSQHRTLPSSARTRIGGCYGRVLPDFGFDSWRSMLARLVPGGIVAVNDEIV